MSYDGPQRRYRVGVSLSVVGETVLARHVLEREDIGNPVWVVPCQAVFWVLARHPYLLSITYRVEH